MLEMGSVRSKNALNVLTKNLIDIIVCTISWYLLGYNIAYRFNSINDYFFGFDIVNYNYKSKLPYLIDDQWFFRWAFASTATTIISGCLAERCVLKAYILISCITSCFIWPFVVRWTWSDNGFLKEMGYQDFAGSGVVHMFGGVIGLVGCVIIGPRKGRFDYDLQIIKLQNLLKELPPDNYIDCDQMIPEPDNEEIQFNEKIYRNEIKYIENKCLTLFKTCHRRFQPHNVGLVTLGTLILWVCWFGFNGGSVGKLGGHFYTDISFVLRTTTMSSSASGITAFILHYLSFHTQNLPVMANGLLGGLVSVTAACDVITPGVAILNGVLTGVIYFYSSVGLKRMFIDDPLDAFAVHGMCGFYGVLSSAVVRYWVQGDDRVMFGNAVGVVVIILFSISASFLMYYPMLYFNILKIDEYEDQVGLDEVYHGGKSYNIKKDQSLEEVSLREIDLNYEEEFFLHA
eukprot:Mrub_02469.p1 GENE.Mrub_02469~~Mrub_02469.p1  ORF type:complete len:498 (+),score=42.28 Mrub_02469:122-1495(+)